MRAIHGLIPEINRPIPHGDVVEHEADRLCLRITGPSEAFHDVIDIGLPWRQQRDAQHRCIHLQGIDHGSQAHQGLQFGIYIDALHLQEGILAIGPRHGHVMQAQFQRPGPEAHSPDRHPAPQHLRGQPLPLATKEWRDREPAQHPEQHERGQGPRQPSGPGSVLEGSQESWKIHCQWRRDAWVFTTRHWTRVHGCPRNRLKQESPEERRHAPPIRA